MADEQLRLVASLKDNATPGVRKIKAELGSVRVAPGMEAAQKWVRGFNADVAQFKKSSMNVASVMSSMGVGGLAAAGSIGALAAAFKTLAERTLDMRELGREVGLTADEINAMNRAGQHFGFDPSKMEGAIRHFAGLMPEFKRGYGELNNILARQPDLIKRLRVEDTRTQIKEIFDFLGTIKNPQDRMVFERGIFGTDEVEKLFADGAGGFEAQAAKARQSLAPITEAAAAQAQALRDAVADFNASLTNLETRAGPTFYRWMTKAVGELDAVLGKIERHPADAAAIGGIGAGAVAALALRRRIMAGSALAGGGEMRAVAGQLAGASGGLDKSALALNEAALALREAAIELRGRGAVSGAGPGGAPPSEPGKPGATSFDKGRALLAGLGLAGVVMNAPGMDEAGDRERDANASALDGFGEAMRKVLGVDWLQGKVDAWRAGGDTRPAEDRLSRARASDADDFHGYGPRPFALPASTPRAFHPDDDDRSTRARESDAPDRSFDFVVGALEKPVLSLSGTLKTAAIKIDENLRPAAFHPAGLIGGRASSNDPVETIAAGTKAGVLAALRELQGGMSADASTARGGIIPASFGGGGGGAGRGGNGGSGGGGNFDFSGTGAGGWARSGATKAQVAAYIRHAFAAQHIDPATALKIASAEGLHKYEGDFGTSFGAFQLHYGGSGIRGMNSRGLGDRFTAETGLNARDPTTWKAQIDFAAKIARREGWGAWHGRFPARVGLRDGIGTYNGPVPDADAYDHTAGAGNGKVIGDALGKLRLARDVVGVQCVALANAAVGFGGSVKDWRRGVNAAGGTLKDGTPVATFLNRDGSQSDRYAGGGIGTEGANRDHAAVFRRYLRDEAGKIVGMTVSEQFRGSHGVHLRNYMFGRGTGEQNGSNYNAIMGPDGKPLGGARNPMSELRAAAEQLRGAALDQRQAARVVAKVPDWHDPNRPDLGAEKRRVARQEQEAARVEGGIDAHVHLHDHRRIHTRVERSGAVRDAGITVRRAPQRTFTV